METNPEAIAQAMDRFSAATNRMTTAMENFSNIVAELNKNLEILAVAKKHEIGPKRFEEYLFGSGSIPSVEECNDRTCSLRTNHVHSSACGPRCSCKV